MTQLRAVTTAASSPHTTTHVAQRPVIRQNPPVSTPKGTGETCPEHGHYHPDAEAGALIRRATSPGIPASIARALLDEAAGLRRWCPGCQGPRPASLDWIASLRSASPTTTPPKGKTMGYPKVQGVGQLISDPKSGTTKTGGNWTNAIIRFAKHRKQDNGSWVETEAFIAAVMAFDDAADVLAGFAKGDMVEVVGTASVGEWNGNPQMKITTAGVRRPIKADQGNALPAARQAAQRAHEAVDRLNRQPRGRHLQAVNS